MSPRKETEVRCVEASGAGDSVVQGASRTGESSLVIDKKLSFNCAHLGAKAELQGQDLSLVPFGPIWALPEEKLSSGATCGTSCL